ncbi:unnamed protein product [Merluccius merluccius]
MRGTAAGCPSRVKEAFISFQKMEEFLQQSPQQSKEPGPDLGQSSGTPVVLPNLLEPDPPPAHPEKFIRSTTSDIAMAICVPPSAALCGRRRVEEEDEDEEDVAV